MIIKTTTSKDEASVRYGLFEGSNSHCTGLTKAEMLDHCEYLGLDFDELLKEGKLQCP